MKVILTTAYRKRNYIRIRICIQTIEYQGVMTDAKLSYKQHVEYACGTVFSTSMDLVKIMPNTGEPQYVYFQVFYIRGGELELTLCTPVCGKAFQVLSDPHKLNAVEGRTTPIAWSVFRTVLVDAAFVISEKISMDILAEEMTNIYNVKSIFPPSKVPVQV